MRPILIAGPANEPVSLTDAKAWLREDNSDEDLLIQTLLVSARLTLEAWTRRLFITQGWRLMCDDWPTSKNSPLTIDIAFAPLQSVTAITIYDSNNIASPVASSTYYVSSGEHGGRIRFQTSPPNPGRTIDGIEIDLIVGYGSSPTFIPEPLRRAILLLVAHWREHRGDDNALTALPPPVLALCAPYRRERLV